MGEQRIGNYCYIDKDLIGSGAFGSVYLGQDIREIDKKVAIKVIVSKAFQSRVGRSKAEERQILENLSITPHPNVVTLLFSDMTESVVYLVMELCNGGDLQAYLKEKVTLNEPVIRHFLQQIGEGLKCLHDKDIIHRDIKPANIMLCFDGERYPASENIHLKLADFGIGRILPPEVLATTFCGTPLYMAPEIFDRIPYDKKADLWSIGIMILECLDGIDRTRERREKSIQLGRLDLEFLEDASVEIKTLLENLITKNPRDRFSCDELLKHPFLRGSNMQSETGCKRKCTKCCTSTYDERDLSCNHVICSHCVEDMIASLGRRFGIECPKCEVRFTRTVVPKDRQTMEPDKCVRDDYDVRIEPVKGISSISLQSKIMGMTILGRNLFVVCKSAPQDIFRFSLGESDTSFEAAGKLNIPKMTWPRGLAASKKDSCLYITDWNKLFGGQLWRYKYTEGDNAPVECPVAILDEQPFGVSVSPETDEVLVTCATPANILANIGWIYIYKSHGEDFSRTRLVELPGLEIPRHAILTPSSLLIVCHGWTGLKSHGVTSFEDRGDETVTRKCFYGNNHGGGSGENDMYCPLSMIIDENGMILVVDYYNHRVQLLTEDFHLVRHLLTKEEHSLEYPRHVCQDALTGRLFVAQENGKIHIFVYAKK